jgi:PAS domain S-box-containing protein
MKLSILIVEDEKIVGLDLASILRTLGYIVMNIVGNGIEAIEITKSQKPDIILMDIGLSGSIDGIETAQKIHEFADIPIVFLTGNSDSITIEEAKAGNPYGYILKPFDEREIRPVLEIALYRHSREKKLKVNSNFHSVIPADESEERYRSLAELSPDCIIIHVQGIIVFANSAAVRTFRMKLREELIGKETLDFVHPDYRGVVVERIAATLENDIVADRIEEKFIRPDGSEFFVEVAASVVYYQQQKGIQVMFRDITNRKQTEDILRKSETLFRQVWENSRDGMRMVDTNGIILLANPAYCELVGKQNSEVVGQLYSNVYAVEQQAGLLDTFRQRIGNHSIITHYEKKLRLWNGKELWLELSNSYVDTDGKNAPFLLSIIRDITERKTIEEQVRTSLMEKESLLKELHHRVKNNMQIISSLLHLQAQNIQDKTIAAPLRESQNRVKSMALVHEQLYQSDNLSEVNINTYLRQLTSRLLRSLIGSSRYISIKIEPEDDTILMNIDTAIPIGLILNELITNSLKYAFVGKENGEICISLHKNSDNTCQMTVRDNGNGIPPEIDISKTETLGLQLVQSLVTQLDGSLQCSSTVDGTTFTITFLER